MAGAMAARQHGPRVDPGYFSFLLQLGRLNSGYSCGWENRNLGIGQAKKKDTVTSDYVCSLGKRVLFITTRHGRFLFTILFGLCIRYLL